MLQNLFLKIYMPIFRFKNRRYLKKRNFNYIVDRFEEYGAAGLEVKKVTDHFLQNHFDAFRQGFEQLRRNDQLLANGFLKSGLVFDGLENIFKDCSFDEALQKISLLENWWQKDKSSFSGGLYALCLYHTGWIARGGGYIQDVGKTGLTSYQDCLTKMWDVLNESDIGAENCLLWNLAHYKLYSDGGAGVEYLNELFCKLIALDPDNLTHYIDHGFRLLPRWFGSSMQDVDDFARQAIETTKEKFGLGVYAMIYSFHFRLADNPVKETCCDFDLLNQAFDDLYQRFGGQAMVNYNIALLDWAEEYDKAYPLVNSRLTAIVPAVWNPYDVVNGLLIADLKICHIGLHYS